jgi:hypothetical protein
MTIYYTINKENNEVEATYCEGFNCWEPSCPCQQDDGRDSREEVLLDRECAEC